MRTILRQSGAIGYGVNTPSPFLHTLAETREFITEIGMDNTGLILDSWHWWTAGDSAEDLLTLDNKEVVSVDLNDAPVGIEKEDQFDNARELPAATGVIEIAPFVAALRQIGYDGPVRPDPHRAPPRRTSEGWSGSSGSSPRGAAARGKYWVGTDQNSSHSSPASRTS